MTQEEEEEEEDKLGFLLDRYIYLICGPFTNDVMHSAIKRLLMAI